MLNSTMVCWVGKIPGSCVGSVADGGVLCV